MVNVIYEIVEHNGGFAYRVGDVFSETFATHESARRAADEAAQRHQLGDVDEQIEYQDSEGAWHSELAQGDRRPETAVSDDPSVDDPAREQSAHRVDEEHADEPPQ